MSADLDREIDRAVRSLLDAEPSPRIRARVLASIAPTRRPAFATGGLMPIVVVGMIVLVLAIVIWPRRSAQPATTSAELGSPAPAATTADARDLHLPMLIPRAVASAPLAGQSPASTHRGAGGRQVFRAAASANGSERSDAGIAALTGPPPLSVDTIAPPENSVMPSIQPAPLRVAALELQALELPRGAARGADQ